MNLLGNVQLAGLRTTNKVRVNSPEIALGLGMAGIIISAVHACIKSVTVVRDEIDVISFNRAEIDNDLMDGVITKEEADKKVRTVYFKGCIKIAGMYAGDIALLAASLYGIKKFTYDGLKTRLARSNAAYAELLALFNTYREHVKETYGEEADFNLLHGIRQENIEVEETDENGKVKKKKKKVNVASANESPYMRYFTKQNPEWKSTDELNEYFFGCIERCLNDKLRRRGKGGFVTLNEAYSALNMAENPTGMVVGWRYDKDNPTGDNYVDLKWHKVYLADENGHFEEAWAIDFNVDGNIYKEMAERDLNSQLSGDFVRDAMQFPNLVKGMVDHE